MYRPSKIRRRQFRPSSIARTSRPRRTSRPSRQGQLSSMYTFASSSGPVPNFNFSSRSPRGLWARPYSPEIVSGAGLSFLSIAAGTTFCGRIVEKLPESISTLTSNDPSEFAKWALAMKGSSTSPGKDWYTGAARRTASEISSLDSSSWLASVMCTF